MYREQRDKFITHFNDVTLDNPEILRFGRNKRLFLIENENMNDDVEIAAMLKTVALENIGVIILFDNIDNQSPRLNKLVSRLIDMPEIPFTAFVYNDDEDRYQVVSIVVSANAYITFYPSTIG